MGMDKEDLKYFDGKFEGVHGRITDEAKSQTDATGALKNELTELRAAPCKDAKEHEEKHHGPAAREHESSKMKDIARSEIAKAVPTSNVARWKHIAAAVGAIAAIVGSIAAAVMAIT